MDPDRRSPPRDDPHDAIRPGRGATARGPGAAARASRYPACTFLGNATIDGTSADLYICEGLVIARFGDAPGEVEAQHLHTLGADASPFLLTAFRLHLERLEPRRRALGEAFAPATSN